jgi:hypothetical protein
MEFDVSTVHASLVTGDQCACRNAQLSAVAKQKLYNQVRVS